MKSKKTLWLKTVLKIIVAFILLFLIFSELHLHQILNIIQNANWILIVFATFLFIISTMLCGWRVGLLLK